MEIRPLGFNVPAREQYLLDEGEGDEVPRYNAMIHELQEGSESEGQHFAKAKGKQRSVSTCAFTSPGLVTTPVQPWPKRLSFKASCWHFNDSICKI